MKKSILKTHIDLQRKLEPKIVYDNRIMNWETILKRHPVESKENIALFREMENCKEYWGDTENPIIILRASHTWDLLVKISKNSKKDCGVFYDIAKHTMLNNKGVLTKEIDDWFKKSLTAIYLSYPNTPRELNYLQSLNQEQKESALFLAFQYFANNPIQKYKELKEDLNIENFNEKLLLSYWNADSRKTNFIDVTIDKLDIKSTDFNLEYIAKNINPNHLVKYQSFEINERFLPLNKIEVETEKYFINNNNKVCLLSENNKTYKLDKILSLFFCQKLLKGIEKYRQQQKNPSYFTSSNKIIELKEIDGKFYGDIVSVFNNCQISKEARSSMECFISNNLEYSLLDKKIPVPEYWVKVRSAFMSMVLSEDLMTNEVSAKKLKV
jgi:hypothetical protein